RYGPSLERAVARRRELGRVWHRPEAREDAVHRRGWIAFGEYFNDPIVQ
ncbi:geranylgeranyl reductase, partial [Ectothiorhodospira haloalkaliphila]